MKYKIAVWFFIFCILFVGFCRPIKATSNLDDINEPETTKYSSGLQKDNTYYSYQQVHKDKPIPNQIAKAKIKKQIIDEGQSTIANVNTSHEGLYHIKLQYGKKHDENKSYEISLKINHQTPFFEAQYLSLFSSYKDEFAVGSKTDNLGNDMTPTQSEIGDKINAILQDNTGSFTQPYLFYFPKGESEIEITASRRSIKLFNLELVPAKNIKDYKSVLKEWENKNIKVVSDHYEVVQAELSFEKSDTTLIPKADRASAATTPYTPKAIKLNVIGGGSWSSSGQWISWEIDVHKEGLYKIALRARQNSISGSFVTRKLYVNDEIQFSEAQNLEIKYNMNWQTIELPYFFHLQEGKNLIKLESSPGRLSEILPMSDECLSQLNYAYRRIVMVTGSSPDPYRDYNIKRTVPEAIETFEKVSKQLDEIDKKLVDTTGEKGSMNAILQTLSQQLKDFLKKPDIIQKRLDAFKTNISALGAWQVDIKRQDLELDCIYVYSKDKSLPKPEATFIVSLKHELTSFMYSFILDYNNISGEKNEDSIEVWVQTGRDQANIIKELIISDFIPSKGINANLKLVQGQLLQATAAGKGPNVVLQIPYIDPMNYATRGALVALSDLDGFDKSVSQFKESAIIPFRFDNKVYALPETQTFDVLFYREDILSELGIEVPQTWQEFFHVVGILQKNNMTVGVQPPNSILGNSNSLSSMGMFLYQRNGEFYTKSGDRSLLSEDNAIEAFRLWISLYQDYSIPIKYDPITRFRTGEMPIIIDNYTLFNYFAVSAPEIKGLWSFTSVPGTENNDGSINKSTAGYGLACMLMKTTPEKTEPSWEFIKWWTSKQTQLGFGMSIENQLGPSARYPTANVEAFKELPWTSQEYETLSKSWDDTKAIPEVPGGYLTPRNINNAFRRVIAYDSDAKETLLEYVTKIDNEILFKRNELGIGLCKVNMKE